MIHILFLLIIGQLLFYVVAFTLGAIFRSPRNGRS